MMFPRHPLRAWPVAIKAVLLSLLLVACDVGEPELPGVVEGRVTGETSGLSGVTVELTGPFNRIAQTDESGVFRFTDVPPGAYVVSIRGFPLDAVFPAVARTATVVSAGVLQVDFQGSFVRTGRISGIVRFPGRGISGVKVVLSGPDSGTQVTRSDGTFSFAALRSGDYTVEISDFSPSIQFPGTKSEVTLQPGQLHEMEFLGRADLTASIVIERLDQVLPDGSRLPADLRSISGTLEIVAALDPGDDTVESVSILVDGVEVSSQQFGVGGGLLTEGSSAASAGAQRLVFAVPTDAFDPRTGVPRWVNGDRLLTLQLTTAEGGSGAASAQAQIRLNNQDTFTGRTIPAGRQALGADGNLWIGGGLVAEVIPVVYNPGQSISALTLELQGRLDQGRVSRVQWSGSGPLRLGFPLLGADGLGGYATEDPAGDRIVVIDARDGAGQRLSGLPVTVVSGLRLDFAPPTLDAFSLPLPSGERLCCLGQWIGAAFPFASSLDGPEDPGVGDFSVTIHAGPAQASTAQLLALPPVREGQDLSASSNVDAYRAIAVLEDILGNRSEVPLQTSGLGATTFGVDLTPPTLTPVDGINGSGGRMINPQPGSFWAFSAQDNEGGLAPLPLQSTIRRWRPEDAESGVCLLPEGTSSDVVCPEASSGLIRPVPEADQGPGYFRLRAQSVDRGGNRSEPVDVWAVHDQSPPEITSLFWVSQSGAGGQLTAGMDLGDDLDLHEVRGYLNFPDTVGWETPAVLRLPAPVPPVAVGSPFALPLTTRASAEVQFPFIAAVQYAGSGDSGVSPGGGLRLMSALEVAALDVAGNAARRLLPAPSVNPQAFRGFETAIRGLAGGIQTWEISVTPLPASSDGRARFRIQAVAGGDAAAFQSPFDAVHFLTLGEGENASWLGSLTNAQSTESTSGSPQLRRLEWSLDWTAPEGWKGRTLRIAVLGVDRAGTGLLSTDIPLALPDS